MSEVRALYAAAFSRSTFDLGYCMGLIVGEGSFTTHGRGRPILAVKLHSNDPEPLEHLKRCLGGRIYGPYSFSATTGPTRHSISWYLMRSELIEALPVFDESLPPSHKREQYLRWRERHAEALSK